MASMQNLIPFIQVVKSGNFSLAAEQLGVSQPAVSKSIARLEGELGIRLFQRTTRQLMLTTEGRDLFNNISKSIEEIDGALESAKSTMKEPKGKVRVAVGATFGRYCLLPVIADFFVKYPEIKLEIDFDDRPRDSLDLSFDLEIRHGQGSRTSYVSRCLLSDLSFILVASPLYLSRRGVPRSIDDLSNHDHISATFTGNLEANWKIMRVNEQPETLGRKKKLASLPRMGPLTVSTHYDTSLTAAFYGIGIAPCLLPAALPFLKSGQLKVVLPDYRIKDTSSSDSHSKMYIQYPHREHLPPKVRVFVDYLLEKFRSGSSSEEDIGAYAA